MLHAALNAGNLFTGDLATSFYGHIGEGTGRDPPSAQGQAGIQFGAREAERY